MKLFDPSEVKLMGVINVTPDSFSDGGEFLSVEEAVEHGHRLFEEGADILDVGGESTRPGAEPVPMDEELKRVVPVIDNLSRIIDIPISVDTYKEQVARASLDAGAGIVNDISALRFDENMAGLIAGRGCDVILMHMKGTPRNMQVNPEYDDPISEIIEFLKERVEYALRMGIEKDRIKIDPGLGFGKRQKGVIDDNWEIMAHLHELRELGYPIVIGSSRKSFIGRALDGISPDRRLYGSLGSFAWAAIAGADILRVHDVAETRDVLAILAEIISRVD